MDFSSSLLEDLSAFETTDPRRVRRLDLHNSRITSLLPLERHTIVELSVSDTPVATLDGLPLSGLKTLSLSRTKVNNLEFFRQRQTPELYALHLSGCPITDLSPILHLPIQRLDISGTPITDISPLATMPRLSFINLSNTRVTDLSPVKGLKYLGLDITNTPITDLTCLGKRWMSEISLNPDSVSKESLAWLRSNRSVNKINDMKPNSFWEDYDAKHGAGQEK